MAEMQCFFFTRVVIIVIQSLSEWVVGCCIHNRWKKHVAFADNHQSKKKELGRIACTTNVYSYCYRPSCVVCCLFCRSVCHTSEPCKNGWTDWDAISVLGADGPKESCVTWGSRSSHGTWQFWGKRVPIVKCTDFLPWAVKKWLNRSICRLGRGFKWAEWCTSSIVFGRLCHCALMEGHITATWRIRLNHPSTAAMRRASNYFDRLLSLDTPT